MITSDFKSPDALVTEVQKAAESIFSAVMGKDALKLLDIGAGTGLVGQKLAARGFTNLEAIDLSPKMLAIAEKKNLYQKLVCDSVYNWRKHFDVGQFDIALSCSVFTPGQLKPNAFDEIICLVKPGKETSSLFLIFVFVFTDELARRAPGARKYSVVPGQDTLLSKW